VGKSTAEGAESAEKMEGERGGRVHSISSTSPARAADQRADLRGEAGSPPTPAQLDAWLKTHPAPKGR
jgi:hypothetical protein